MHACAKFKWINHLTSPSPYSKHWVIYDCWTVYDINNENVFFLLLQKSFELNKYENGIIMLHSVQCCFHDWRFMQFHETFNILAIIYATVILMVNDQKILIEKELLRFDLLAFYLMHVKSMVVCNKNDLFFLSSLSWYYEQCNVMEHYSTGCPSKTNRTQWSYLRCG